MLFSAADLENLIKPNLPECGAEFQRRFPHVTAFRKQ